MMINFFHNKQLMITDLLSRIARSCRFAADGKRIPENRSRSFGKFVISQLKNRRIPDGRAPRDPLTIRFNPAVSSEKNEGLASIGARARAYINNRIARSGTRATIPPRQGSPRDVSNSRYILHFPKDGRVIYFLIQGRWRGKLRETGYDCKLSVSDLRFDETSSSSSSPQFA